MLNRRSILRVGGVMFAGAAFGKNPAWAEEIVRLPFANGERPLVAYPGKRPLIRHTSRPPQLETPFSVFDEGVLTPNDAFFVRYHLADIPLSIDPETYALSISGKVERPQKFSLRDLKSAFEAREIVAVAQCSGNSRGFVDPRVGGGQLANGAMGNARWRGVPLRNILDRVGIAAGARQIVFNGLDQPAAPETPDFMKALDIDHARDGDVMLAYAMNGEDLPWLNGYPLRLVVPGYYATYWVKHLSDIRVIDETWDGFWMKSAYRTPDNDCACTPPGEAAHATRPIARMNVRSFITSVTDRSTIRANRETLIRGIAFDGGEGIATVLFSDDAGRNWRAARPGPDHGRYSFREWTIPVRLRAGEHMLMSCAINRIGQSQPLTPLWGPSGYMRNAVETVRIIAS
jgi:sulfite dehydrogenase